MTRHRRTRSAARAARIAAAVAAVGAIVLAGAAPAHADTVRDYEYWLDDYGITTAWGTTRGEGVTVAMIDTGVNGNVAELRGVVAGGTDVSGLGTPDGQTPGRRPVDSAHGTLVASLAAGRGTGAGNGVIGVAPEAELLAVSVGFGQDTGAEKTNDEQIAEAVRWAVDNGADVINMSLTTQHPRLGRELGRRVPLRVRERRRRGRGRRQPRQRHERGRRPGDDPRRAHGRGRRQGEEREPRGELAGHHDRGRGAQRGPRRRAARRAGRDLERHERRGAARRRASPPSCGRRIPTSTPPTSSTGSSQTADPNGHEVPTALYGFGLVDPVAALEADVDAVDENPMGSLAEWITLHRRATSETPAQSPEEPEIVPIADPPLPDDDATTTLLPTPWTARLYHGPALVGRWIWYDRSAVGHRRHSASQADCPHSRAVIARQAKRGVHFTVPKILIVGGGYAGFYTAWKLEK